MWINLHVQKEDASKISTGQEVCVRVDGMAGELRSTIAWISTEVNEETRTLQARAEVENPIIHPSELSATGQRLLRANTFVTGSIRMRTSLQAIVVPSECVHADDQDHLVFVQTGTRSFEGRRVRRGITSGSRTEVFGDVSAGEVEAHRGRPSAEVAGVAARGRIPQIDDAAIRHHLVLIAPAARAAGGSGHRAGWLSCAEIAEYRRLSRYHPGAGADQHSRAGAGSRRDRAADQ